MPGVAEYLKPERHRQVLGGSPLAVAFKEDAEGLGAGGRILRGEGCECGERELRVGDAQPHEQDPNGMLQLDGLRQLVCSGEHDRRVADLNRAFESRHR